VDDLTHVRLYKVDYLTHVRLYKWTISLMSDSITGLSHSCQTL